MLKNLKYIIVASSLISITSVFAGNESRRGQAGATELLINPWGRSSGMAGANTAGIIGVEAMNFNVAGLAKLRKTELSFTNTRWLSGTDISINSFAFGTKLGDNGGALGISVTSMSLGDIDYTTVASPDGTGITFKPQLSNIAISYSKIFSKSISGGITIRAISHTAPKVSALGIAIDAGLQYQTKIVKDSKNMFHFGVGLRNVGPPLKYQGDGLSATGSINNTNMISGQSLLQKSNPFEMPALLNIGVGYDFVLVDSVHVLTLAGNFNSNSFTRDQLQIGIEYGFKNFLMFRAGLDYQKGVLFDTKSRNVAHTGPTFGLSLVLPFGEGKISRALLNYSYRTSNPFAGTHGIGLTLSL